MNRRQRLEELLKRNRNSSKNNLVLKKICDENRAEFNGRKDVRDKSERRFEQNYLTCLREINKGKGVYAALQDLHDKYVEYLKEL